MHSTFYLISLLSGAIATFIYVSVIHRYTFTLKKQLILFVIVATLLALLVGSITGSFDSHGFGIPQWLFSLFFFLVCMVSFLLAKLLRR